jgi:hypothetical protein
LKLGVMTLSIAKLNIMTLTLATLSKTKNSTPSMTLGKGSLYCEQPLSETMMCIKQLYCEQ